MPTIRRFRARDAKKVSEIVRRTMQISNAADYPLKVLQPLVDYYSPEKILQLNDERDCLIAETDGKIVGTIALEGDQIVTFFVQPEAQGAGIGAKLLAAIERLAFEKGIRRLFLDSSVTARRFYEKMNYRTVKNRDNGNTGEVVEMEKTLENL